MRSDYYRFPCVLINKAQPCRFRIYVKNTDRFQCAVRDRENGWMHVWSHDALHDPCPGCKLRIEGKSLTVDRELGPAEFLKVAGKRIRKCDWEKITKDD